MKTHTIQVFLFFLITLLVSCSKNKPEDHIKDLGFDNYFNQADDNNLHKSLRILSLENAVQKTKYINDDTLKRYILAEISDRYNGLGEIDSYFKLNTEIVNFSE